MNARDRAILEELAKRKLIPNFPLESLLFKPQLSFVRDTATFKTAVCSRRAGKSVGCAADLLESPLKTGAPSLYFTLTRGSAKRIIWPTLLELNREHNLGFEPNESELVLKRNGQALVFLSGANNRDEIEKWRGIGWGKVIGDEAQALPEYLREAVQEVLMPSLMDHNGSLALIGTPSAVPSGYFHECCSNPEWAHHSWTVFENPWIQKKSGKPASEHLAMALRMRGVTADDPAIQREYFGRWVYDPNSLVFKFVKERNTFTTLPALGAPWVYVLGADLGFDDADALAVLAFNPLSPAVFLVEEWTGSKQTITQLAERMEALVKKYDPISIVMDTGGLGKKIAEEISARFHLPIKAAEKTRKLEFIELVNDALRTGRMFVLPGSQFAVDALKVEWDRSKPGKLEISDRFHSDICDAVLYAYRESLHWLHEAAAPPPPPVGSAEWLAKEEERMEAEALKRFEEQEAEERDGIGDSSNWELWATQ